MHNYRTGPELPAQLHSWTKRSRFRIRATSRRSILGIKERPPYQIKPTLHCIHPELGRELQRDWELTISTANGIHG